MVYTTVTAHRGHVHLQSAPGQGTRVTLTFPACEPAPRAAAAPAPPPAEPSGGPLHVLVVDDDLLVLKSTEMMVAALGHAARSAPTGEEALALIEGGFRPRLVILDMNMPGLGGGGTLPLLRKLVPDAHVLLATGRADQEALNLVTSFPGVELLPKPFSLDDLRTRLTAPTAK